MIKTKKVIDRIVDICYNVPKREEKRDEVDTS